MRDHCQRSRKTPKVEAFESLRRKKLEEIEDWLDKEVAYYTKSKEAMDAMKEGLEKTHAMIKLRKSSDKMELLNTMMKETVEKTEGFFDLVATEFRRRFAPFGPALQAAGDGGSDPREDPTGQSGGRESDDYTTTLDG